MNIEAKLLHYTPMEILVGAIRQCYESGENSDSAYEYVYDRLGSSFGHKEYILGDKDERLVKQIIESNHTSTLEHIAFNFQLKGISRLNLQELARHRMASLSVKSTRYTLKELKTEEPFIIEGTDGSKFWKDNHAKKYINLTGIDKIDGFSIQALENLRQLIASGEYKNDEVKYALPECYRLDLYWTINARSLQNFLTLRLSEKAHFEIRELANKIFHAIPKEYKFLFKI